MEQKEIIKIFKKNDMGSIHRIDSEYGSYSWGMTYPDNDKIDYIWNMYKDYFMVEPEYL